MSGCALGGVVPGEIVVAVREVDVGLVEDGGPLEGGAVEALAGRAVAIFCGEGFGAGELVARFAAVAVAGPEGVEVFGGSVDLVGGEALPVV